MIELPITPEIIHLAQQKADEMGTLRGSITEGTGNLAGFIGELLVCQITGAISSNDFQHDLNLEGCVLLEVKTKQRTKAPLITYEVDVAARNVRQKADYYVFVSVLYDQSVGHILGCMPKYEYLMESRFREKGTNCGGFVVKASCFSMPIKNLRPIEEIELVKTLRTTANYQESELHC